MLSPVELRHRHKDILLHEKQHMDADFMQRPTVQREIPQENLLKYPLCLEKYHPVGCIAAVGIGS